MPEEASLVITNSGVPGFVPEPGFIDFGEITLNWADKKLYFKDEDGVIQQISVDKPSQLSLTEVPQDEGPWITTTFPGNPANTAYIPVQKQVGNLPRIKIGSIATGENSVSVDGEDITVSILAGTTTNQIKGLIENNVEADALIYFYNAGSSNGTGIAAPLPIESAVFNNVNTITGVRADFVGQIAQVSHSDFTLTRWVSTSIIPTKWFPESPGILKNRTNSTWERLFIQDGIFQSEVLLDQ